MFHSTLPVCILASAICSFCYSTYFYLDFSRAVISTQLVLWRSLAFLLTVDICYLNFLEISPREIISSYTFAFSLFYLFRALVKSYVILVISILLTIIAGVRASSCTSFFSLFGINYLCCLESSHFKCFPLNCRSKAYFSLLISKSVILIKPFLLAFVMNGSMWTQSFSWQLDCSSVVHDHETFVY